LIDKLLDDHLFSEITDILNDQGVRPGSVARRDQRDAASRPSASPIWLGNTSSNPATTGFASAGC
jgi:hypothetical protein